MIVVLDTNVLVSGIFFHGPPALILEAWVEGRFEVTAIPRILEEYFRVLEEVSTLKAPRFEHPWRDSVRTLLSEPQLHLPKVPVPKGMHCVAGRVKGII